MEGRDTVGIESLFMIWPIAASLATHMPAGDLISLSRANAELRAALHEGLRLPVTAASASGGHSRSHLCPPVGYHQTRQWAHLKSLSPFLCSSKTHTRGQKLRPCVYCCRPICDACIVRDSFKRRNENTFKKRLRYMCRACWYSGNPPRTSRYPLRPHTLEQDAMIDVYTQSPDKSIQAADVHCRCTLKDSGWLCLPCKEDQNTSGPPQETRFTPVEKHIQTIQCFGLNCTNEVDLSDPDKNRRRMCLWCEKPLPRQFGGEDRYAWNMKTIEVRTMNAESRSQDIEEYNRKRWKELRMSRNELRGHPDGPPEDDKPEFVRHLDTINYRKYLSNASSPSPEDVWNSKLGLWRYSQGFLLSIQIRCHQERTNHAGSFDATTLQHITKDGAGPFARTNSQVMTERSEAMLSCPADENVHTRLDYITLKSRILDEYHGDPEGFLPTDVLRAILVEKYDFVTSDKMLNLYLTKKWNNDGTGSDARPTDKRMEDLSVNTGDTVDAVSGNRDDGEARHQRSVLAATTAAAAAGDSHDNNDDHPPPQNDSSGEQDGNSVEPGVSRPVQLVTDSLEEFSTEEPPPYTANDM